MATVVDDIDDNDGEKETCGEKCSRCCHATYHCRAGKWNNPAHKGPGWIPLYILMYIFTGLFFAAIYPFGFLCMDICFFCHDGIPSIKEKRQKVTVVEQTSQLQTTQPVGQGGGVTQQQQQTVVVNLNR